jgi:DNA-binding NtrC family response regulator
MVHAQPDVSLLLVTDKHLRDHDRAAIKLGIDGFMVRPVRQDHIYFQIAHIREVRRLRQKYERLREEAQRLGAFHGIVGASSEMNRVFHLITRAAASSVPVALYGESGTGKELVARAIHDGSPRREGPFVAVNPASMPESLLESELYGYVRGAFTGAAAERLGYIESAQGGTLFLDEIGDLPLSIQGKFLRVLQERTLQRIGSSRTIRVDFRLITATHRDLMAEVRKGRFREDLFYRLHVFPVYLPSLRSRPGDIPLLAEHFLKKFARELGHPVTGFAPGVVECLMAYGWPGNVRELENVIHRAVALKADGAVLNMSDLSGIIELAPARASDPAATLDPFPAEVRPLNEHIREYVMWAYRKLNRNKSRTARLLEIDRATLYRKLRQIQSRDKTLGT